MAERCEGVVNLPAVVTFPNQPGEGQSAGMFADGGEAGAGESTDFLEG